MMWREHGITGRLQSTADPTDGAPLTLKRLLAATVLFVIAPLAAAHAQGVEGMRSVTVFVGTGISLAGNAINEGVGTIDGKPSVLVEQALSNHFSDALRLRFTGSLGLDYSQEVFATFAYGKYNGTERIVGSVSGYPLLARLSNADAFDIEGGLRYYLRPEGPIRTYVAGAAGLRFLQATDATFRVVEVGLTSGQPAVLQGIGAVSRRRRYRCQLRRIRHDGVGSGARASVPGKTWRRTALCGSEARGRSTTRAAAGRFRSASSRTLRF